MCRSRSTVRFPWNFNSNMWVFFILFSSHKISLFMENFLSSFSSSKIIIGIREAAYLTQECRRAFPVGKLYSASGNMRFCCIFSVSLKFYTELFWGQIGSTYQKTCGFLVLPFGKFILVIPLGFYYVLFLYGSLLLKFLKNKTIVHSATSVWTVQGYNTLLKDS